MFVRDPIFNIDAKINSQHYHFSQEEVDGKFEVEMKANLPYFPTTTVVTKCKKILNNSDELLYVNSQADIPYEFVN